MNATDLPAAIRAKRSYLCVGLDTDATHLPKGVGSGAAGVLAFNKAIIEATKPYAVAYKVNVAFYEAMGTEGWHVLEQTRAALPDSCYLIADAKRGDIGNTASRYAQAFFGHLAFDALTVNPYMGTDTLEPYLAYPKGDIFVLACTSNPGFAHFENLMLANGRRLYEEVVAQCQSLTPAERVHFVAGATHITALQAVRTLAPKAVLLVPGIGAQGGNLSLVSKTGFSWQAPLLVNASRSVLFASLEHDFAQKAAAEAARLAAEMSVILESL